MIDHLGVLSALCGPDGVLAGPGLFMSLLVAGAVGSLVHCGPMCGPFVLAQVSGRLAGVARTRLCERHRVTQGLLVPYHAGRLVTYAGLGALASGSGRVLGAVPGLRGLPAVLLGVGAVMFAAQAIQRIWPGVARLTLPAAPWAGRIAALARGIDRRRAWGGFLLGAVLGFLPCGFLYAALAVAAAAPDPGRGAMAMAAFGLGTVPGLMVVGVAGRAGFRRFSAAMNLAGPAVLLGNAAMLGALAWQRLALAAGS